MSGKKTHRIYARDQKAQLDGLETSRGKVDFGMKTAVYVDKETAEEVDARYGLGTMADSVIVAKDEQYDRALNGEKWDIVHSPKGDWVKTLHKWKFQGVDTSHIRITKDNGFVWAYKGGKQVWMKRKQAQEEGLDIVPQKRFERRKRAEVDSGISSHEPGTKYT